MPNAGVPAEPGWIKLAGRVSVRVAQFVFTPLFVVGVVVTQLSESWPGSEPTGATLAYGLALIASVFVALASGVVWLTGRILRATSDRAPV